MNNYVRYESLGLSDDFMFWHVMDDEEIMKHTLEHLLKIKISRIEKVQPQRVFDIEPDTKGIRLDVFVEDDQKNRYAIEMQKSTTYNLSRRSRYYHSMMDLDLMSKGEDYENLRDSVVIFICDFDPFKLKKYRYTFEQLCLEDRELYLQDGRTTIFLSTAGENDADAEPWLIEFLRYVENSSSEVAESCESELVKMIHRSLETVRNDSARRGEYMKLRERLKENRELGRAEGIFEGIFIEKIRIIRKYHLKGHDLAFIVDLVDENKDMVEKIIGIIESDSDMSDAAIAEAVLRVPDSFN